MAYVGTPIDTTNQFQSLQGKRFSGDGSTTAFTLDIAPSSVFDIEVFVENVRQDPNSAYSLSGTTMTFTGAPASGTNNIYVVHQAKAVGTINPTNDSVTASAIADDAVESEHLNNNIISGQTALGAAPADTDEFLVSDAGTIKRVDYSYIKAVNTPSFQAYLGSNTSALTNGTQTKIQYNTEEWDTDNTYDNSSNYRFTPAVAGKYWLYATAKIDSSGNFPHDAYLSFYKNGSVYKQFQRVDNGTDFSGVLFNGTAVDLDADDYIEVYIVVYDGVNAFISSSQSSTLFGAYKIIGA
jgi:hypothetical protein